MANYNMHEFTDENGNVYAFTDPTARDTANKASALSECDRQLVNGIGASVSSYVWLGRDIAKEFASEIGSTPPITWLLNRAKAGNFKGLLIGDYLQCTLNDTSHTKLNFQIAAFDMYYGVGDTTNGHMITLVPTEVYPEYIKFNETSTNQGSAENKSPWKNSYLYKWMNGTFYGYLPTEWKNALKDIRVRNDIRYSESGALTNSNGSEWMSLGKVWAPSEIEVFGSVRNGTQHSVPFATPFSDRQLPIFANGRTVIRSRIPWWERVAAAGDSSRACIVSYEGYSYAGDAAGAWVRPLCCFHIG